MSNAPETVASIIRAAGRVNRHPAYGVKQAGSWRLLVWGEVDRRVRELGNGLLALGVGRGDRVALLAQTRLEWTLCDYAVLSIGAIAVPIYPTSSARDVGHILADAAPVVVICEDAEQAAKLTEAEAALPVAPRVIVMEEAEAPPGALGLDRLAAMGVAHAASYEAAFDDALEAVRPDDPATYIYTSGTTGPAKGCILLHRNYAAMTRMLLEIPDLVRAGDRCILFLPLAHTFARLMQFAATAADVTLYFAESIPQVPANLLEVRPHLLPSVPRVLEKIHGAVEEGLEEATGARARLATWALGVGGQVSALRQAGRPVPFGLRLQHRAADRLVFSRIKARLGGEVRYVVSGGAPLAKEIAEFFHAVDILVLEGYGLTEATTAVTLNRPHRYRFGTVGPPFPHCEVRVADDGEIECRGPHVFAGYHGDPDATASVLRPGGWLATGDVGRLDDDGFLAVTDRKKDLIVTAGGKNVAPQNIENLLRQRPAVSQVVVIGDRRPFLTTLVTLDPDELARVEPGARPGDERSRALVQRYLDEVNGELASFEQIRRFAILDHDFSPESGELTPTLKVKRRLIADRYRSQIDALYAT